MHPFDEAIELTPLGKDRFRGATSPAYANMVGPFGGITNAILLQAAMLHTERLGEPIALTVNFAGPVADGDFEIQAEPVRTNRSTQHWSINLVQGETIQAVGSRRTIPTTDLHFPCRHLRLLLSQGFPAAWPVGPRRHRFDDDLLPCRPGAFERAR